MVMFEEMGLKMMRINWWVYNSKSSKKKDELLKYSKKQASDITCLFGIPLGNQKTHFENTKPKFCVQ